MSFRNAFQTGEVLFVGILIGAIFAGLVGVVVYTIVKAVVTFSTLLLLIFLTIKYGQRLAKKNSTKL